MRKLLVASVLTVLSMQNVMAQEEISTLRDLKKEARTLIKEFELTDLKIEVGAPEYKSIREQLHVSIQNEIAVLDGVLQGFNNDLSTDYSLIVSLKKQKRDAATKRTIEIATQRLTTKAQQLTSVYHNQLKAIILLSNSQMPLMKKCVTVLCVEKIAVDFQNWFKKAKNLNRSLDLEVTEMNKISNLGNLLTNQIESLENNRDQIGKYLPVALSVEQYNEQLRIEAEKVTEAQRIQAEKEAEEKRILAKIEEARLAKDKSDLAKKELYKRKSGQPYGCQEIVELKENDIFKCKEPFKMVDGKFTRINTLNSEIVANVCAAHGLKAPVLNISWVGNEKDQKNSTGYFFDHITCDSPSFNGLSRLNYERVNLADGSILLNKLTVTLREGIAHFDYISKSAREICELLGFRDYSEAKSDLIETEYVVRNSNRFEVIKDSGYLVYQSFKCNL